MMNFTEKSSSFYSGFPRCQRLDFREFLVIIRSLTGMQILDFQLFTSRLFIF